MSTLTKFPVIWQYLHNSWWRTWCALKFCVSKFTIAWEINRQITLQIYEFRKHAICYSMKKLMKSTLELNKFSSVQSLSSVWLCNPMDCSTPGLPVHHQLPECTETHVHWVGDAIQPSHPSLSPSPPAFNLSQHQGLFKWVRSLHQVAKVLELWLQHQSFQWIFRIDFL